MALERRTRTMETEKNKSPSYKYKDYGKLNHLSKLGADHIDQIYEFFGITKAYRNEILIKSTCPIHNGDNDTALNMYYNGDYKIHYKCRTHQCEDIFGNSFFGFIRGCLSRHRYKWEQEGDRIAGFSEAVEFVLDFLDKDFESLEAESVNIERMKFGSMINSFSKKETRGLGITQDQYRAKVEVPAQYYLDRGFSKEVLEEYDVGYCDNHYKPMFERAVVPIYDNNHEYIVGCTGRSVHDQCKECKSYHGTRSVCRHFPKWLHSKGFQKEKWLYNYWKAKESILETGVAILVESPGNVWRLAEAGIYNSVAIFGTAFNTEQKHLLDESGALSLICLMDNDEAGKLAAKKIEEQCSRLYRIYFPSFKAADVADLNVDAVTADIKPFITKAKKVYKDF
jgi:5S rRNA maturation endonuclease (ribonuclease M5)